MHSLHTEKNNKFDKVKKSSREVAEITKQSKKAPFRNLQKIIFGKTQISK